MDSSGVFASTILEVVITFGPFSPNTVSLVKFRSLHSLVRSFVYCSFNQSVIESDPLPVTSKSGFKV